MRIKCCGITRPEDARFAEQEGADAIGVVMFSDSSPRSVSVTCAQDIFHSIGPLITTVVVTHTTSKSDLSHILEIRPDAIQISHPFVFRSDPGVRIIRAIRPGTPLPDDCDAIVVDDSQGGGKHFDRSFARDAVTQSKVPVILAGGLTPENVGEAIREIHPYAVDVATGIERSPGIKDPEKIRSFIAAVRRA